MKSNEAGNAHLTEELDLYSRLKSPGYAVLIDAPWGAGKTHFVKRWMFKRKDAIYLSIYGVSNAAQFELALLEAIFKKYKELKPSKNAQRLEEVAKHLSGLTLGFSDIYRRIALRSAPQIIIIDDLERSNLSANETFGIINDHLEHNKKNIILLSHQEKLIKKWADPNENYAEVKEKVIGQVLSFEPNAKVVIYSFDASGRGRGLSNFLKSIFGIAPKSYYKSMLLSEVEFIKNVFDRSESKNLRLLRQSLRDFSRIYPMLIKVVGRDKSKVRAALGSYLALSIAYHGGRGFDLKSLEQENSWDQAVRQTAGEDDNEPEKTPTDQLKEKYLDLKEIRLDGLVISGSLAVRTVAKGMFNEDFIREELLKSPYLGQSETNSWLVLWHWRYEKPDVIRGALHNVLGGLRRAAVNDPVILLHIFCILRDMEIGGVKLDLGKTVEQYAKDYIDKALSEDRLPTKHPKAQYQLSITELNYTSYGFIREGSDFFCDISVHLEKALDRSFWNDIKKNPEKFSSQLYENPMPLMRSLDNRASHEDLPNYAYIPVLGFTNITSMLESLEKIGPKNASTFVGIIGRRLKRLDQVEEEDRGCEWPNETEWMRQIRDELAKQACQEGDQIAAVQMSALVRHMESFL